MIADASFILSLALLAVIGLLAAAVLLQLLDGTIEMRGLLLPSPDETEVQPERLLLLGLTIFAGLAYFSYGLSQGAPNGVMPDIPDDLRTELLAALGGGNALYLFRKFTFVRGRP
ncbi:MAG TPA: hypothetical protein VN112_14655 [Ensifer sp.]|nr:hypothetical protein [Ensifer sp.]